MSFKATNAGIAALRQHLRKNIFLTIASLFILTSFIVRVEAASISTADLKKRLVTTSAPVSPLKAPKDGTALLNQSLDKASALTDYVFNSGIITYKNNSHTVETGRFYFKKPRMIRVEVKKSGVKSGSILVLDANGKIEAKPGGLMKFMKLNLTPDSDLLKTANGYSMLEVDYVTLLGNSLKEIAQKGYQTRIVATNVAYPKTNDSVSILEVVDKDTNKVRQRIALSETNQLPVEWSLFKNEQLYSTSVWRKLELNPGLAADVFHVAYHAK